MKLVPIRRPRLGLHIGPKALTLVERLGHWSLDWFPGRRIRSNWQWHEQPVAEAMICPSASALNVGDVAGVTTRLETLVGKRPRPIPVALSLPDLCARIALFELETVPQNPAELDAWVRWRLQKECGVKTTETRLIYRLFRQIKRAPADEASARLVAVWIRESIIAQYEEVCQAAGLLPVSIGLSSFLLFDLYGSMITAQASEAEEVFFLTIGSGSLLFMALRSGCPVFLRVKPLRGKGDQSVVMDEILASLQFYARQLPVGLPERGSPLFVVGETDWVAPNLCFTVESLRGETLRVTVKPMSEGQLLPRGWSHDGEALNGGGLSALACLSNW